MRTVLSPFALFTGICFFTHLSAGNWRGAVEVPKGGVGGCGKTVQWGREGAVLEFYEKDANLSNILSTPPTT